MSGTLSELLLDDSFVRFLKGNSTPEEFAAWTAWVSEHKRNAELYRRAKNLIEHGIQDLPIPNSETELDRLTWRMDSYERHPSYSKVRSHSRSTVWTAMAVAASILLVVGFFGRHTFLQLHNTENQSDTSVTYRTWSTETGQKTSLQYSDGSKVVINANSYLRMPDKLLKSDTMQVWLEGEALFSITNDPDSRRAFIVNTPDGRISVLGTVFSVNTTKSKSRVVLSKGQVRLEVADSQARTTTNYIMKPGELAEFSSEEDKIDVRTVNATAYTSWAGDTLILDDTPLYELIERIEFTYDVTVDIEAEELLKEHLTGRLENLNLDFLLTGLAQVLNVDISKEGKTVFIRM